LATEGPLYSAGPPRRRHSISTQAAKGMAPDALRVSSSTAATCFRRAYSSGRNKASALGRTSAPPSDGAASPAATGIAAGSCRAADAESSNKAPCAGFSVSSNKDPWRAAGTVAKGVAAAFAGAGRNSRSSRTGTGVT